MAETVIVTMACSYMLGIGWRIFVTITIDWENNDEVDVYNGYETFYSSYDFYDGAGAHVEGPAQFVRFVYFALTSLSTIGYGDFCPKAVSEKLLVSGVLLVLVSVYSYNMSALMGVLADYRTIACNREAENQKDLVKWLGLLTYINGGVPIKRGLQDKIEDFFQYYWAKDRMRALKSERDKKITD
jgi:hypothetical protein